MKKIAGAYTCGQAVASPQSLQSQLTLSSVEGPYDIKVTSTILDGAATIAFSMNRDVLMALSLPEPLVQPFLRHDWKVESKGLGTLAGGEILLNRLRVPGAGIESFVLLVPPGRESLVRFEGASFAPAARLLVVAEPDRTFVGTGFVSLYLPATAK